MNELLNQQNKTGNHANLDKEIIESLLEIEKVNKEMKEKIKTMDTTLIKLREEIDRRNLTQREKKQIVYFLNFIKNNYFLLVSNNKNQLQEKTNIDLFNINVAK